VLLLELDVRQPALDRALGLAPPGTGLSEYLRGRGETPVIRRPMAAGFWLLSAGSCGLDAPAALGSARLPALLEATDRVFDEVVVDCPPLLPTGDAAAAQELLDGFVFVVRVRRSPREAIQEAASLVGPEAIAGLVLNASSHTHGP
jgi:Mrp family chromosome partitioning ATPase